MEPNQSKLQRPTKKARARVKPTVLALTPERAPLLLGEPVEEALLPELVLLAVPLDREAEAAELVGAALADVVVAPAPAALVEVDAAAVELPPAATVEPLTIESFASFDVVLL